MDLLKTFLLFAFTAVAEIVGCCCCIRPLPVACRCDMLRVIDGSPTPGALVVNPPLTVPARAERIWEGTLLRDF